jgi:hypothetical protein
LNDRSALAICFRDQIKLGKLPLPVGIHAAFTFPISA